ncbi:MAG TPA: BON domain-containing protein [Pyrinomonadaceae bacterium]|nr:BON domain-containing protein [Pyrinomonadaceae bacterium]
MSYDEQQQRKSRVVVETPTARREVVETQVARVPERRGLSGGAVAALVIGAVALVTILFLFLMNRQDELNANVRVATAPTPIQQQPPVIVQQPTTQQPPVIVQQPAAPTTAAPIIVTPPSTSTSSSSTTTTAPSGTDDASVQSSVDKKLSDDATLGSLGILATVIDGKVTLTGSVNSEDLKTRAERLVKAVKGVKRVDNQITVTGAE